MPITNPFLQPVRSAVDYSNDYAQADARRNQNALQALTLEQATQSNAAKGGIRNALASLGPEATLDKQIGTLRSLGTPEALTQADSLDTSQQNRQKSAASAAKDQAEADAKTAEVKWKLADRHAQQLAFVQTPEDAVAYIDEGIREGSLPMAGRERAIAMIQQGGLAAWKQAAQQAAIPVVERFKQDAEMARTKLSTDTQVKTTGMNNETSRANTVYTQGQENARAAQTRQAAVTKPFEVTGPDGTPMLVQQDKAGNITPVPGFGPKSGSSKPLTNDQANARLFATRMQEADQQLGQFAEQGVERPGNIHSAADAIGLGSATNWTQSPKQQGVEQAQRNFVNAVLRKESGAAISNSEFENARKQYFPQIGDSDEVIAQKAQNRKTAIEGMLAQVPSGQRPSARPAPAKPAAPAAFVITHVDGKAVQ